jgi:lipopolysaccharide biosynthesis protein WzzE
MGRKIMDLRDCATVCVNRLNVDILCSSGVEATAITDRPTVNMLGGYYSQQQFLRNLDVKANLAPVDQISVMDEAYKEFVMQLASWDTRRDFWMQTDYFKQRKVGNSKADAAMLDDLINYIQYTPGDVRATLTTMSN